MTSTELELFSYNDHEVRTVMIDGEPWFVARDVCDVLEITNSRDALTGLDEDEKSQVTMGVANTDTPQEVNIVSEAGMYSLILRSRKPEAKAFKRWVTHEVLPSLRKTGSYSVTDKIAPTVTTRQKSEALALLQYQTRVERALMKKGLYRNAVTGEIKPLPAAQIPEGLIPPLAAEIGKDTDLIHRVAKQAKHLINREENSAYR